MSKKGSNPSPPEGVVKPDPPPNPPQSGREGYCASQMKAAFEYGCIEAFVYLGFSYDQERLKQLWQDSMARKLL